MYRVIANGIRQRSLVSLIAGSQLFDVQYYQEKTGMVFSSPRRAVQHYLGTQIFERSNPHPLVSLTWYRDRYPDVAASGVDPLVHFLQHGADERRSISQFFDTDWYLNRYPDVRQANINALNHYLIYGAYEGRNPSAVFRTTAYLEANPDVAKAGMNPLVHYAQYGKVERRPVIKNITLDQKFGAASDDFLYWREQFLANSSVLDSKWNATVGKIVFVILDAYGTRAPALDSIAELSDSLFADTPPTLESCGFHTRKWLTDIADEDLFVFIKDHDVLDKLSLVKFRVAHSGSGLVFTFDMFFSDGDRVYPVIQPGANVAYLQAADVTFSRFALKGSVLSAVLQSTDHISNPRELLMRSLAHLADQGCMHAFKHLSAPVLKVENLTREITAAREKILDNRRNFNEVSNKFVSVLICTKDKGRLVDQLVRKLVTYKAVKEVIVVSNRTEDFFALRNLDQLQQLSKVDVLRHDGPFNFSKQSNLAAHKATGEFLLFLNDDIFIVNDSWLECLLGSFKDSSIGAVGPLLLYGNERVQHAGMHLGYHQTAGHTLRHSLVPDGDYQFMTSCSRDVSCITGAALIIRRSIFIDLNGFDEQLASIYQDVDMCLRVRDLGYRLLFVPEAVLIHLESVSISDLVQDVTQLPQRELERSYFIARFGLERLTNDEFFGRSFNPSDEYLRTLM